MIVMISLSWRFCDKKRPKKQNKNKTGDDLPYGNSNTSLHYFF
jgi:hypothetical protein